VNKNTLDMNNDANRVIEYAHIIFVSYYNKSPEQINKYV